MLNKNLIAEAVAAITAAADSEPTMVDDCPHTITRLASDMGLTIEAISEQVFVARDLEEEGQKFDFWMFCKYGKDHMGQTVTGITLK